MTSLCCRWCLAASDSNITGTHVPSFTQMREPNEGTLACTTMRARCVQQSRTQMTSASWRALRRTSADSPTMSSRNTCIQTGAFLRASSANINYTNKDILPDCLCLEPLLATSLSFTVLQTIQQVHKTSIMMVMMGLICLRLSQRYFKALCALQISHSDV